MIAGFPTETEAMFEQSLDIVDACGLTYLHVFPFSPRKGTSASRMPQVVKSEIKSRAARLRAKGDSVLRGFLASQVGRTMSVLVEGPGLGRTPDFAEFAFVPAGEKHGSLVDGTVTGVSDDGRRLTGILS